MDNSFKILPEEIAIPFEEGETFLEAILKQRIDMGHACGGMGTCGTCHVFIHEGRSLLEPRNELELERAQDLNFAENERLACQVHCVKGVALEIPQE